MRVILETPRLILRELTLEDAEDLLPIYTDPEIMRNLAGSPVASVEAVREGLSKQITRYESTGWCYWAVVEKVTGHLVGRCGLLPLDGGPETEVGYHFHREAWGKGYATEAARACVEHGFRRLGLSRIVGVTFPDNEPSKNVLLKAGMRYEGRRVYFGHELDYFSIDRPETVEPNEAATRSCR